MFATSSEMLYTIQIQLQLCKQLKLVVLKVVTCSFNGKGNCRMYVPIVIMFSVVLTAPNVVVNVSTDVITIIFTVLHAITEQHYYF